MLDIQTIKIKIDISIVASIEISENRRTPSREYQQGWFLTFVRPRQIVANQSACTIEGIGRAFVNINARAFFVNSFVPIIANASVITNSVITRAVLLAVEITN